MTYIELYNKAVSMLDNAEITAEEFNTMVEPLNHEIWQKRKDFNDDENGLVFMHPKDGMKMLKEYADMKNCLVVSAVIPEGTAIVVSEDEFLDWLFCR